MIIPENTSAVSWQMMQVMASPGMVEISERDNVHCQQYFEALASIVGTAADADDGGSVCGGAE